MATIGGIEVSRGIRGSAPATNCPGQPQESFGQHCKFITFCNCSNYLEKEKLHANFKKNMFTHLDEQLGIYGNLNPSHLSDFSL